MAIRSFSVTLAAILLLAGPLPTSAQPRRLGPGPAAEEKPPASLADYAALRARKEHRIQALELVLKRSLGKPAELPNALSLAAALWELAGVCEEEMLSPFLAEARDKADPEGRKQLDDRAKRLQEQAQAARSRAVSEIESALATQPQHPALDEALFYLGYYRAASGQEGKAARPLARLVQEFPASQYKNEALLLLGEVHFSAGKLPQALAAYRKVLADRRCRLVPYARYKAAWCLYNLGKGQEALDEMVAVAQMTALHPDWGHLYPESLKDTVLFYSEVGAGDKALAFFGKLDDKRQEPLAAHLATLYADQGKLADALALCQALRTAFPKSAHDTRYALLELRLLDQLGRTDDLLKMATSLVAKVGTEAPERAELRTLLQAVRKHHTGATAKQLDELLSTLAK